MMNNKKSLLVGFVLGVAACGLTSVGKRLILPTPRQALPFFASIKEEVQINGFLPDFSYKLEAEIKPRDFDIFVRRMRFPAESRRNAMQYVLEVPENEYKISAEYRDGTLYFEEWKY